MHMSKLCLQVLESQHFLPSLFFPLWNWISQITITVKYEAALFYHFAKARIKVRVQCIFHAVVYVCIRFWFACKIIQISQALTAQRMVFKKKRLSLPQKFSLSIDQNILEISFDGSVWCVWALFHICFG